MKLDFYSKYKQAFAHHIVLIILNMVLFMDYISTNESNNQTKNKNKYLIMIQLKIKTS